MSAHPAKLTAARADPSPGGQEAAGREAGGPVGFPEDLDLELLEEEARQRVGEMAYAYYAGGAEDERLLAANVGAWRAWQLHPRTLVDVSTVSTATEVLGTPMAAPLMVAPTAIHGLAHPFGEVATARGAAGAGVPLVLSSLATRRLEDVADAAPGAPRWMQVYVLRDRGRTAELVRRAAEAGYRALVLTVDAPVSGLRRRELRQGVHLPIDLELPNLSDGSTDAAHGGGFMEVVTRQFDPALTYDDVTWLRQLSGLPVLVKGVLRADDAERCVEAGASGVVVSNHGARQLDDGPPTAEVLPEVAAALDGRGALLVDGGLRRAPDVVKALCLGADAVLIGRPVLWALASGGAEGVTRLLQWLVAEFRRTLALCGAPDVAALGPDLLRRAGADGTITR